MRGWIVAALLVLAGGAVVGLGPRLIELPEPARTVVACFGGWFAFVLLARAVSHPRSPGAGAEVGRRDEPPAVAAMLTNRWTVPTRAVVATVLDLGHRGLIELTASGDVTVCRVRRDPDDGELRPSESRVLDFVRTASAAAGSVPLSALYVHPDGRRQRANWTRSYRAEVTREAYSAGLARRRYPRGFGVVLGAAALVPVAAVGYLPAGGGDVRSYSVLAVLAVVLWTFGYWITAAGTSRGTRAGRVAAGHWGAVRERLADDPTVAMASAATSATNRDVPYAVALGAASGADPELPREPADKAAWSNVTGSWRRVRVVDGGVGFGMAPALVLLLGGWATVVTAGFGLFLGPALWATEGVELVDRARAAGGAPAVVACYAVLVGYAVMMVVFVGRWTMVLPTAVRDLVARRTVDGTVIHKYAVRGTDTRHAMSWFLVVDDGRADAVRAMNVGWRAYRDTRIGERVRVVVTPGLWYVRSIETLP